MLTRRLINNKFIGIKKFEKVATSNYVMMAQSIEDYVNGTPMTKTRRRKYTLMNGFMVLNAIKFGILVLFDEPWLLVEFGEFLHVFYHKFQIFAFLAFMCFMVVLGDQAVIYYLERRGKFVILDIFHQMITKNRVEGMSPRLANKLLINAYLMSKVILEVQVKCITALCCIIAPIMIFQAHMSDVPHSPFRLAVNGVAFVVMIRQGYLMAMSHTFLFVMSMMYLKYSFTQTLNTVEGCIKNKRMYRRALLDHKRFSLLLTKFSPFINSVIGNLYNLSPVIIIISMQISLEKDLALWKRCFIGNLFITSALGGYFVNKLATWFPLNNRKISKWIYRLNYDRSSGSIQYLLKLDEFLSSQNEMFFGFHCYNMFEMTKLTFYKYLFGISVTYIMTVKTINDM